MFKLNEIEIALLCATAITIVALAMKVEGAKDIALALGGGIVGYLGGRATNDNTTPPKQNP